jgi:WbqC-like protein
VRGFEPLLAVILAAHQPAYLPWLGYFDKIARADVYVFLDTVQFEKNSFINRNRIKTPGGVQWVTIPVRTRGHLAGTLRDTSIDDSQPWRDKHLRAIAANYGRAPHFRENFPKLEAMLRAQETNLAEFCWRQLRFWLDEFRITTRLVRSSDLDVVGNKSGLILELCRVLGATRYLAGALGRDYLEPEQFAAAGITIEFQQFAGAPYPQRWGGFLPFLSIVDYWMNCGTGTRPFGEHGSTVL